MASLGVEGYAAARQNMGQRLGAGMLADNDGMVASEQPGIKALVGLGLLEKAGDVQAALVGEHVASDNGLAGWHATAGRAGNDLGERSQRRQVDAGRSAVEAEEGDRYLFQSCVAGPFAEAEHGDRGLSAAGAQGGERVGGGETEVVVAVELKGKRGASPQVCHQFRRR